MNFRGFKEKLEDSVVIGGVAFIPGLFFSVFITLLLRLFNYFASIIFEKGFFILNDTNWFKIYIAFAFILTLIMIRKVFLAIISQNLSSGSQILICWLLLHVANYMLFEVILNWFGVYPSHFIVFIIIYIILTTKLKINEK